jgi:uncharacterized protein involved in exopolysaccharide biosynthesis
MEAHPCLVLPSGLACFLVSQRYDQNGLMGVRPMPDHSIPIDGRLPATMRLPRRWKSRLALRMAAVSGIVLAGSIAAYPLLPRIYLSTASIQIRPTSREGATTWDQSVAEALDDNAIQTKVDILSSQPMQQRVIATHNLLTDPEFNPALHPSWLRRQADQLPWLAPWLPGKRSDRTLVENQLAKNLVIKRERKSYLLQVGYQSYDPIKSATLSNSLVDGFLEEQIGRRRDTHQHILAALHNSVEGLEQQYHRDEAAEHDFAISSGLVHIGERDSLQQQLVALSNGLGEARRRSVDTANRAMMLTNMQRSGRLDATSDTLNSPMFQRLHELLVELSTGTHGESAVVTGAAPATVAQLRATLAQEEQRLVSAAQNDAAVAAQNEIQLHLELAQIDAKLVGWRTKEWRLDELHRVVQTDLNSIDAANQRYNTEAGRGDALQPDVEIVAPAMVPDRPRFPQPLLYAGGTMALIILINGLMLLPTILRASNAR